jgi:hypothetical protein
MQPCHKLSHILLQCERCIRRQGVSIKNAITFSVTERKILDQEEQAVIPPAKQSCM